VLRFGEEGVALVLFARRKQHGFSKFFEFLPRLHADAGPAETLSALRQHVASKATLENTLHRRDLADSRAVLGDLSELTKMAKQPEVGVRAHNLERPWFWRRGLYLRDVAGRSHL